MFNRVHETESVSFTCPYCSTDFTKKWEELECWPDSKLIHRFHLSWAECSKCNRFMVVLKESVGAGTTTEAQIGGAPGWEWKTIRTETIWPQRHRDVDALTGLLLKRVYEEDVKKLVGDAFQAGRSLALVFFDIDDFGKINKEHPGKHSYGDQILRGVGGIIAKAADGRGSAYRWGGEELVVLLKDHDAEEGRAFAEKVRKKIESSEFGSPPMRITVSAGVASYPTEGTVPEVLFKKANEAMLAAKKAGKNQTAVAPKLGSH